MCWLVAARLLCGVVEERHKAVRRKDVVAAYSSDVRQVDLAHEWQGLPVGIGGPTEVRVNHRQSAKPAASVGRRSPDQPSRWAGKFNDTVPNAIKRSVACWLEDSAGLRSIAAFSEPRFGLARQI